MGVVNNWVTCRRNVHHRPHNQPSHLSSLKTPPLPVQRRCPREEALLSTSPLTPTTEIAHLLQNARKRTRAPAHSLLREKMPRPRPNQSDSHHEVQDTLNSGVSTLRPLPEPHNPHNPQAARTDVRLTKGPRGFCLVVTASSARQHACAEQHQLGTARKVQQRAMENGLQTRGTRPRRNSVSSWKCSRVPTPRRRRAERRAGRLLLHLWQVPVGRELRK